MAKKGGNPQNLKVPTSEEARKNGQKGGKKSGEVRVERKTLRKAFEDVLNGTYEVGGKTLDGYAAIALSAFKEAMAGSAKHMEIIRDTTGEKPTDKLNLGADNGDQVTKINLVFGDRSKRENFKDTDPLIIDGGALKNDTES